MRSVYPGGRLNEINNRMSSKLILEETVDSTRKLREEKHLQKFIFYTFDTGTGTICKRKRSVVWFLLVFFFCYIYI